MRLDHVVKDQPVQQNFDRVTKEVNALTAKVNALATAVLGLENLRAVRGTVTAAGGIGEGTGYTVNRTGTGLYVVTWSPVFSDVPSLVVTPFLSATTPIWTLGAQSSTSAQIAFATWNTGAALDTDFNFVAVGPR